MNLLGAWLTTRSFTGPAVLVGDYVSFLDTGHKAVRYNLVGVNFQITSWNRMLAALGGPALDLRVSMVLAGFAVWGALILARLRIEAPWRDGWDRRKLDPAYLLAMTSVGAVFCAQVLASELILLVLLAPLILQRIDAGRRRDVWVLVGLLLFLLIPLNLMDQIANGLQLDDESRARTLLRSHKCFGLAALAAYLLVLGPLKKQRIPD
jgi:hypothetical protein